MKAFLFTTAMSSCAVLAFALYRYDECFRNPTLIFWWFGVPISVALLALAFLVLPRAARLALASTVLSLSLFEAAFYGLSRVSEPDLESYVDPEYYQAHTFLGWGPKRGITTRAWKKVDGETVYDVEYSIDDLGRRVTPAQRRDDRTRFLLFFGGSFMFGEGVGERETLPFFVGEAAKTTMPYNYAFHGYGPQHLLAKLESDEMRGEVEESEGILLYLFIDAHVNRTIGSMVVYTSWADVAPYYVFNDLGNPVRKGSFTTGRAPISLLYSFLARSQVLNYFNVDIPPVIMNHHVELTARIFARSAGLFQQQFGPQRFIVVIFPGSSHALRLSQALSKADVDCLDYSTLFDHEDPQYFIAEDWHPSPRAYRILADQLVQDLDLAGS